MKNRKVFAALGDSVKPEDIRKRELEFNKIK
jgi:hypothetical protein